MTFGSPLSARFVAALCITLAPSALVIAAACNGQTSGSCAPSQTSCNDVCTTLTKDPVNCGACGKTCSATELCSHGACVSVCGTGEQGCQISTGGFCTDIQSDNANCGACGTPCKATEKCLGGQCGPGCTGGQTGCTPEGGAPYCANIQADGTNCGGCGNVCKPLEVCSSGACVSACATGQTGCAGADGGPGYCAKTDTDNGNCGVCGTTCGVLQTCISSACKSACLSGQTACFTDGGQLSSDGGPAASYCTTTVTDNANCGACFNVCPYTKPVCIGSSCYALDAGPG